ncbi:MAG: hypothetical protein HY871_00610, partial [Chloroflexi bacterium]|nr:hypothetical protein [Chloroflexota bacterium]
EGEGEARCPAGKARQTGQAEGSLASVVFFTSKEQRVHGVVRVAPRALFSLLAKKLWYNYLGMCFKPFFTSKDNAQVAMFFASKEVAALGGGAP